MNLGSFIQLIAIGAIWGSSFVFLNLTVPTLGPLVTATARCLLAGSALVLYFFATGFNPEWKKSYRHYFVCGILQFALPFTLFAFASRLLPPSYPSILNATSPLFGALLAWLFFGEDLRARKVVGLLVSICGVAIIVKLGVASLTSKLIWPILACLVGSLCYAIAGLYVKTQGASAKPLGLAGGGALFAGLMLLPFSLFNLPASIPSLKVIVYLLMLSLLCTSLAFLLYYKLIITIGTTKAFLTAFLIPVFTMLWSFLFLHKKVSLSMLIGTAITLVGVFLVVYTKPKKHQ